MSEQNAISRSEDGPITQDWLEEDLSQLGVLPGMTLLLHSSLSSLGWVVGGPVAVIKALLAVLGADGTLVMPTHTSDLCDPEGWSNPPVDPSWWPAIREAMPAFEPDLTPTRGMGVIPECFRSAPGVLRSDHPQVSFAAFGPKAEFIIQGHELSSAFGESSPVARIYDLNGHVLLLGVGHDSNSSLHLSEVRADYPSKRIVRFNAPVSINGERQWVEAEDIDPNADDFPEIGGAYEQVGTGSRGLVGHADSILCSQRELVDFGVKWTEKNRS